MGMFDQEPDLTPEEKEQKRLNAERMAAKNPQAKIPLNESENQEQEVLMEDYNPNGPDIDEAPDLPYMPSGGGRGASFSGGFGKMPKPNENAPEKFDPNMLFQKGHPLADAAKQNAKKMSSLMGTFDKMGVNTIKAGGKEVNPNGANVISNVKESLANAAEHIANPENWLPKGKENLAPRLKELVEKNGLLKALRSYVAFMEKFE